MEGSPTLLELVRGSRHVELLRYCENTEGFHASAITSEVFSAALQTRSLPIVRLLLWYAPPNLPLFSSLVVTLEIGEPALFTLLLEFLKTPEEQSAGKWEELVFACVRFRNACCLRKLLAFVHEHGIVLNRHLKDETTGLTAVQLAANRGAVQLTALLQCEPSLVQYFDVGIDSTCEAYEGKIRKIESWMEKNHCEIPDGRASLQSSFVAVEECLTPFTGLLAKEADRRQEEKAPKL